jgi:hypothetical protein
MAVEVEDACVLRWCRCGGGVHLRLATATVEVEDACGAATAAVEVEDACVQ